MVMQNSLSKPLKDLKAANLRLRLAIADTVLSWPLVTRCWIDKISEPTLLLEEHKVCGSGGVTFNGA
jgi:hypothetical protein